MRGTVRFWNLTKHSCAISMPPTCRESEHSDDSCSHRGLCGHSTADSRTDLALIWHQSGLGTFQSPLRSGLLFIPLDSINSHRSEVSHFERPVCIVSMRCHWPKWVQRILITRVETNDTIVTVSTFVFVSIWISYYDYKVIAMVQSLLTC